AFEDSLDRQRQRQRTVSADPAKPAAVSQSHRIRIAVPQDAAHRLSGEQAGIAAWLGAARDLIPAIKTAAATGGRSSVGRWSDFQKDQIRPDSGTLRKRATIDLRWVEKSWRGSRRCARRCSASDCISFRSARRTCLMEDL